MTNFRCKLIDGAGNNSQGRNEFGMTITLQCLCRNGRRRNAQLLAHILFYKGIYIGISTDSTGNLTDRYDFLSSFHAFNIAFRFSQPHAQFQTESRSFGMNTVGTTDSRCIFKFNSTTTQNITKGFQIGQKNFGSLFQHVSQSRIFYVR